MTLFLALFAQVLVLGGVTTENGYESLNGRQTGPTELTLQSATGTCQVRVRGDVGAIRCSDGRIGRVVFIGEVGYGSLDGSPLSLVLN